MAEENINSPLLYFLTLCQELLILGKGKYCQKNMSKLRSIAELRVFDSMAIL
jgi:hypothetical protein